jgi:hypothetical protein
MSSGPRANWSTEQDMRGTGMLFNPQRQLIINTRQVRVLHHDGLKGIQPCSVLWCQLCHAKYNHRSSAALFVLSGQLLSRNLCVIVLSMVEKRFTQ